MSNSVKESVQQFQVLKELAKQFIELVEERDFVVEYDGYNDRCTEIDDKLIPQIIAQIPPGMMGKFNQLVNSALRIGGNSPDNEPIEKVIDQIQKS